MRLATKCCLLGLNILSQTNNRKRIETHKPQNKKQQNSTRNQTKVCHLRGRLTSHLNSMFSEIGLAGNRGPKSRPSKKCPGLRLRSVVKNVSIYKSTDFKQLLLSLIVQIANGSKFAIQSSRKGTSQMAHLDLVGSRYSDHNGTSNSRRNWLHLVHCATHPFQMYTLQVIFSSRLLLVSLRTKTLERYTITTITPHKKHFYLKSVLFDFILGYTIYID